MKQEDIISTLQDEFGLEKKQVELIINNFWSEIRHYFTNPLESKGRIILPHVGTFNIFEHSVDNVINKIETKGLAKQLYTLEFYNELKQTVKRNGKRQAKQQTDNE